jgi:hypothetical protein
MDCMKTENGELWLEFSTYYGQKKWEGGAENL